MVVQEGLCAQEHEREEGKGTVPEQDPKLKRVSVSGNVVSYLHIDVEMVKLRPVPDLEVLARFNSYYDATPEDVSAD